MMIPQKFKDAEIQLCQKDRARALKASVIIHFLQEKETSAFAGIMVSRPRGLVEEQLMQLCSQGNLRKAENKSLYIVFVK